MKKLLAILLSMVLFLGCFAACGNGDAAETIATTEEPEVFVTTQIIKGGASDYVIVHDGSTSAKDTATTVRNAISKEFGVSLDMVSNKEREESGCEIVVGEAREIAQKTMKILTGKYDFALKVEENKLVLCAKDKLSYKYLALYLAREVFLNTQQGDLTLDSDDNVIYSQSQLAEKNYVDYLQEDNGFISLDDLFDWGKYENADITLPYRIYVPFNYTPDKSYPLVVNLHGAGHIGNDNMKHLKFFDQVLNMPEVAADDAIILYPQCPEGNRWVNTEWGGGSYDSDVVAEANALKAVVELMGQLQQEYSIDSNRIYGVGLSMGAYGMWNIFINHPGLFTAAIAMCGAGDPSKAELMVDTPIWAIHGALDPTVPVSGSQDMVKAIEAAGGTKIKYTELADAQHDVWTYTYANQEMFTWLFSQVKQ